MNDRIEAIKERLAKATPGEWEWCKDTGEHLDLIPDEDGYFHLPECALLCPADLVFNGEPENRANDARLLVNAPTDLAFCVAEIERLRKVLGEEK